MVDEVEERVVLWVTSLTWAFERPAFDRTGFARAGFTRAGFTRAGFTLWDLTSWPVPGVRLGDPGSCSRRRGDGHPRPRANASVATALASESMVAVPLTRPAVTSSKKFARGI